MRILLVAGYLPAPPTFGAARRLHGLISHLASTHSLTLLALVDGGTDRSEEIRATGELCEHVTVVENDRRSGTLARRRGSKVGSLFSFQSYERHAFRRPALQAALDDLIAREAFDVLQIESVLLGGYRLPAEIPTVLDEHNIEYDVLTRTARSSGNVARRAYSLVNAAKLRREEEGLWRSVDGCAVPSERDAAIVRAAAPETHTAVVPNGVDTSFFLPRRPVGDERSILFFGALNYHPNVDALEFFAGQIMPRIRDLVPARLTVVGMGASPRIHALGRDDIEIVGKVADVRPVLDDAAVVVAPLRFGGGTRLKILEAMAMARPVVSTTVGAEGISARDGEHLLIADTPEAFATAVARLLDDPSLRRAIGEAGRRLVEQHSDWRQSSEQLEQVYRAVIARGQPGPALPAVPPARGGS